MSGMYFQSWTFCELVMKAQLTVDSLVPVTPWHCHLPLHSHPGEQSLIWNLLPLSQEW